jgi:hypothetical protein
LIGVSLQPGGAAGVQEVGGLAGLALSALEAPAKPLFVALAPEAVDEAGPPCQDDRGKRDQEGAGAEPPAKVSMRVMSGSFPPTPAGTAGGFSASDSVKCKGCTQTPCAKIRRMRGHLTLLVLALAAAATGVQASSVDSPAAAPGGADGPEILSAGTVAEFAWNPGDFSRADEMELVLSLDGGRTFPLRVTDDLSLAMRRISWRVPALPAEHARVALRVGCDEEEGSERIVFVSDEFAIRIEGSAGLEELYRVRGEWRTREALDGPERSPFDAQLAGSPAEQLRPATAWAPASEPPRSVSLSLAPSARPEHGGVQVAGLAAVSSPDLGRPRVVPLRS